MFIYRHLTKNCSRELTIDNASPKIIAAKSPLTVKPGTKRLTSNIIKAFKISEKSPRVINVIGSVRSVKTGLTKVLSSPKTTATISAVDRSGTLTSPGTSREVKKTAKALMINFIIRFIIILY